MSERSEELSPEVQRANIENNFRQFLEYIQRPDVREERSRFIGLDYFFFNLIPTLDFVKEAERIFEEAQGQ